LPTDALVFAGTTVAEPKKVPGKKKGGKRASENLNLSFLPQEEEDV
jgi:hypothetical protein